MDRYSGKRSAGGLVGPRKAYNSAFKEVGGEGDPNTQFCNRIGCSGRVKCSQNTRIGISDKAKSSKYGNEITERGRLSITSAKKSNLDSKRKSTSQPKVDQSESSLSSESEDQGLISSPTICDSESTKKYGEITTEITTEIGSSSVSSSNVRPRKTFNHKYGLHNQNTAPSSSVASASRSSVIEPLNRNGNRYGLRNLKCNSISDVVPPNSSPIEKNTMNRRNSEGESSSSSRGRKTNPSSSLIDRHISSSPSISGISISDSKRSNSPSGEDLNGGPSSIRRSMNVNTRMRFSHRQSGRNSSSSNIIRESDTEFIPFRIGGRSSSRQFSPSGTRSYSNGDNSSSAIPFASSESGFTHNDVLHRYNMDGIAEVLLALERIGQDEELTHEQVLALETSLFFSGLNLYDQHRDMRLDIDHMSYEELLALEEKMGTVSTALSEEELSKCISRSIYQTMTPSKVRTAGLNEDGDDIKCCICQEEYVIGDGIGKLVECQHGCHLTCLNQWLQLKNWCPICKSSAAPSQSSSSSSTL